MTHIRALSLITHGETPETFNLEIRKCQLSFWEYTNLDKIFTDNFFVSSKLILVNQHDNVLNVKVK